MDLAARAVDDFSMHKLSLLVIDCDARSFYAPVFNQALVCTAVVKGTFNPVHFGNKYKIPISNFRMADSLINHINAQSH